MVPLYCPDEITLARVAAALNSQGLLLKMVNREVHVIEMLPPPPAPSIKSLQQATEVKP